MTSFTLRADQRGFQRVYRALSKELGHLYKGIKIVKKRHGSLSILCGRRVTWRLAFIPPPVVVYPEAARKPLKREEVKPPPREKVKKPRVAIVIDDIGNDLGIARDLLNLPVPVTLSIFPFAPHAREIAREAVSKGYDILMHLPMEPEGYPGKGKDPGTGALYVSMTSSELVKQLNQDLDQIPEVCGINNHMGSRFTSERRGMKIVMEVLKKRKKIFLDSRTSRKSVGYQVARECGIPTVKRDVFLDNTRDVQKIREQLDRLIEEAKKRGYAVGIGHPHRATYLALKKALPGYLKNGIEFVFVSTLVH